MPFSISLKRSAGRSLVTGFPGGSVCAEASAGTRRPTSNRECVCFIRGNVAQRKVRWSGKRWRRVTRLPHPGPLPGGEGDLFAGLLEDEGVRHHHGPSAL